MHANQCVSIDFCISAYLPSRHDVIQQMKYDPRASPYVISLLIIGDDVVLRHPYSLHLRSQLVYGILLMWKSDGYQCQRLINAILLERGPKKLKIITETISMFGTLKSTKSGKDPYLIEAIRPPFEIHEAGKHQTNACTNCREKKVVQILSPRSSNGPCSLLAYSFLMRLALSVVDTLY